MKRKYAIFIGDPEDMAKGKPWVLADLGTRIVLGTYDAIAYSVDAVVFRTRKKPVEFWLDDYKFYYEVRYWVEIRLLSPPR